jgi:hypothetical protein
MLANKQARDEHVCVVCAQHADPFQVLIQQTQQLAVRSYRGTGSPKDSKPSLTAPDE